jgi:hypothetical protein
MAISVSFSYGNYVIDDGGANILYYPYSNVEVSTSGDDVIFVPTNSDARRGKLLRSHYSNFTSPSGSSAQEVALALVELNTGADVNLQDQTTDPIIAEFNNVTNSTTLSSATSIGDRTITLTSTTGAADGKYIILFHPASERFTTFYQIGAAAGNVITLDSPMDFAYPAGTFVDIADTNMNVDGSTTPVVFGLRGTGTPPGVELTFDLTRIMIGCRTTTAVDLAKFGDLTRLTNGLVFRKRDGRYKNVFNVKSNGELATMAYDWDPQAATNPTQGQDGFVSRLTFGSQGKIGVVIRLEIGEDAEIIVQDDLTGLERFGVIGEGHIVEGN